MEKLIKALPAILAASGDSDEVAEAACVAAWKHVVGQALLNHAVAIKLQDQTLVVAVADAIWKKQLEHMRPQLLYRLNTLLGQSVVKLIELRVDPKVLAAAQPREIVTSKPKGEAVPFELLAAAAEIHDAELRRAFLGAAMSCMKRIENQSEF